MIVVPDTSNFKNAVIDINKNKVNKIYFLNWTVPNPLTELIFKIRTKKSLKIFFSRNSLKYSLIFNTPGIKNNYIILG